jgi:hypothetical protein
MAGVGVKAAFPQEFLIPRNQASLPLPGCSLSRQVEHSFEILVCAS